MNACVENPPQASDQVIRELGNKVEVSILIQLTIEIDNFFLKLDYFLLPFFQLLLN